MHGQAFLQMLHAKWWDGDDLGPELLERGPQPLQVVRFG